jgi:hypothetical protein
LSQNNVAVAASSSGITLQGAVPGATAVLGFGFFGGTLPSPMPGFGSALIDAGDPAAAAGLALDVRGLPRVAGARVDIGAVEREAAPSMWVVNLSDTGSIGSLRHAAGLSAQLALPVRFQAGLSGTISNGSTLALGNGVQILGPGADRVTLAGASPVLLVPNGATVAVRGLVLAGGQQSGVTAAGIVNFGSLTATGVWLRDHAGRCLHSTGTLDLIDSTLSGCSLDTGVALNNTGTARLQNVTIAGNGVTIPSGLAGSVLNGSGATLHLRNVTITENSGGGGLGAGVANSGALTIENSIVSGNSGAQVNGSFIGANNLIGMAAGLGAFQRNDGPMPNYLPNANSAALNAGNSALVGPPPGPFFDQRGISFPRIVGSAVDIGAIERGCALPPLTPLRLPQGRVGESFSVLISTLGNGLSHALVSGDLAPGLTYASAGVLGGVPTAAGRYRFTLAAVDTSQCRAGASYTLTIAASGVIFIDGFDD